MSKKDALKKVLRGVLLALLIVCLVAIDVITIDLWVYEYKTLDPQILVIGALGIGLVSIIDRYLYNFHSIMRWGDKLGSNIALWVMEVRYIGPIYGLLMLPILPFAAMVEESLFRLETSNWLEAIPRSIAFGLAHMLSGVAFHTAITLSLVGLGLTYFYFVGGVELSTKVHFHYNFLLMTLLIADFTIRSFKSEGTNDPGD